MLNVNQVYCSNPGKVPQNYTHRENIDQRFLDSIKNHKKPVLIYGESKQGKTCLWKNNLDKNSIICIECTLGFKLEDFLEAIAIKIDFEKKITNASILKALSDNFKKVLVIEEFHFIQNQEDRIRIAQCLKAFQQNIPNFVFVIVGAWVDEESASIALEYQHTQLNGRVELISADTWENDDLFSVIERGESLLNIAFSDEFKKSLVKNCSRSVFILQEVCRKVLVSNKIMQTQEKLIEEIGSREAVENSINEVISNQGGAYSLAFKALSGRKGQSGQAPKYNLDSWIMIAFIENGENINSSHCLSLKFIQRYILEYHPEARYIQDFNIKKRLTALNKSQAQGKYELWEFQNEKEVKFIDRNLVIWIKSLRYDDRANLINSIK